MFNVYADLLRNVPMWSEGASCDVWWLLHVVVSWLVFLLICRVETPCRLRIHTALLCYGFLVITQHAFYMCTDW